MKEYSSVESLIKAVNGGEKEVKLKLPEEIKSNAGFKLVRTKILAEFIVRPETKLEKLDLSGNALDPQCIGILAKAFANNISLKSISLNANAMGSAGVKALAPALEKNRHIQELFICGNKIGDEGVGSIVSVLIKNSSLKVLSMNDNDIGDKGAASIAELLDINTSLVNLGIRSNKMTKEGFEFINSVLAKNTSIENIKINIHPIFANGSHLKLEQIRNRVKLNSLENKAYQRGAIAVILKLPNDVCGLIVGLVDKFSAQQTSRVCVDAYKATEPKWAEKALAPKDDKQNNINRGHSLG